MEAINKITYLLGAGASCRTIPIVKETPEAIVKMLDFISKFNTFTNNSFYEFEGMSISKKLAFENFKDSLQWLAEKSQKHASIDTLAKKFFITKNFNDLSRLKITLSFFYILLQYQKEADIRYDAFFASILGNQSRKLPNNLNIISWNYDFQLEKSYSQYSLTTSVMENQDILNMLPSPMPTFVPENDFCILKLNGTTLFIDERNTVLGPFTPFNDLIEQVDFSFIEKIIYNFTICNDKNLVIRPYLSFAWENYSWNKEIINSAKRAATFTNTLVVIGYSFPFFNRIVDREIINSMPMLKKVYLQGPAGEPEKYKDRFKSIRDDFETLEIEFIHDTDSFFLPYEL